MLSFTCVSRTAALGAAVVAIACLSAPSGAVAAQDGLELCNESSSKIKAALAYRSRQARNWVSAGWFILEKNGDCDRPIKIPLQNRAYYVLGVGDQEIFGGDHKFCILQNKGFRRVGRDNCFPEPWTSEGFAKVWVGDARGYTVFFRAGAGFGDSNVPKKSGAPGIPHLQDPKDCTTCIVLPPSDFN